MIIEEAKELVSPVTLTGIIKAVAISANTGMEKSILNYSQVQVSKCKKTKNKKQK